VSGGAGYYTASEGFAGEDPPAAPIAVVRRRAPVALAYAPPERDVPLDDDGQYLGLHPVDQKVRLALLTTRGSSPAAPDEGFDWTTPFAAGEALQQDVTDRIRNALARSGITSQDIEEVRIEASRPVRGRVKWRFVYRNLHTLQEQTLDGDG
jgi:hypothetical protein